MYRRFATRGGKWVILVGVVVLLEVLPGPTLSHSHVRAIDFRDSKGRLILASELYLIAHLWGLIPDRYDPLRNLDKIKVARNVIA